MNTWTEFLLFAIPAILFCAVGAGFSLYSERLKGLAITLSFVGTLVLGAFIARLWITLGRPPLRTMGETRLWYSFFVGIAGILTYARWKYRWILSFTTVLAAVFCIINLLKPELHDKSLMPALQSAWFVPHVTVYMFSYSLLGCSFLLAIAYLIHPKESLLVSTDNLVYVGVALLSFGMLSGAVWAKQAWGDYWTWDPKETWAAITWAGYLLYIHLRLLHRGRPWMLCAVLIFSFITLQMCWYGISFLPAAQQSMHVYSN